MGHTKHNVLIGWSFLDEKVLECAFKNARIIITHAGMGSIIRALKHGKKPIVVPRLKQYNEHVNNHQTEIAKYLEKWDKVIYCRNLRQLPNLIKKTYKYEGTKSTKVIDEIKRWIKEKYENSNC